MTTRRAFVLLAGGSLLVAAANMRWGIGLLAWVAPVPLLRYLRFAKGWRSRVALAGALVVAWTLATAKIVTAPLPPAFALLGVAFGLYQALGFTLADAVRRRMGPLGGVLTFPTIMAVLEVAQYRLTELASWTAVGYTQVDDLPLLQIASVTGVVGVGLAVNLVAAALEHAWAGLGTRPLAVSLAVVAGLHAFGMARLSGANAGTVRAAAVGTTATFGPQSKPSAAEREHVFATLLADTEAAARAGATVVVWTEASMFVPAEEEQATIDRLRAAAARHHIHLVAAYVVPGSPRFDNKLVWLRPDGGVDHVYRKHHPSPGEPARVGTGPLPVVLDGATRMGAALCYDYDFPQLAAEHGAKEVDLVALPSSDWRGIDPLHTQMATLRAIEQGVSIIRSTRAGLSAGIDARGRVLAWSSSFDGPSRVLVVDLPSHGKPTIYRGAGDGLVLLIAFVLSGLADALWGAEGGLDSVWAARGH